MNKIFISSKKKKKKSSRCDHDTALKERDAPCIEIAVVPTPNLQPKNN